LCSVFHLIFVEKLDRLHQTQIAKAVHEEVVTRDMVPAFVKLLKDTEAEVRTAIAGQIPGMIQSQPCGINANVLQASVT
jgi:hypothetical protein